MVGETNSGQTVEKNREEAGDRQGEIKEREISNSNMEEIQPGLGRQIVRGGNPK